MPSPSLAETVRWLVSSENQRCFLVLGLLRARQLTITELVRASGMLHPEQVNRTLVQLEDSCLVDRFSAESPTRFQASPLGNRAYELAQNTVAYVEQEIQSTASLDGITRTQQLPRPEESHSEMDSQEHSAKAELGGFWSALSRARHKVDEIDRRILAILQENPRAPVSIIARTVGLTDNAVRYRVRRLQQSGAFRYRVEVLGEGTPTAILLVKTPKRRPTLQKIPPVVDSYWTGGEYGLVVVVSARTHEELLEFINGRLRDSTAFSKVETLYVEPGNSEPHELSKVSVSPRVASTEDKR